ncbi:MAG: iron-sulfur cluster assembly accessory protein [SAR324 cluster bacterium]|nr:iron-sulfur cluster assembly accessory protein [SAR324 cluster bacterium]
MSNAAPTQEYEVLLTEKAANVIRDAYSAESVDPETAFIRIGALPGGCSGYKFTMDFAEHSQLAADDAVFHSQGINLVVDRTCLSDILGSVEVDFQDDNFVEQGFAFRALRDSAQCGCGQSFKPVNRSSD